MIQKWRTDWKEFAKTILCYVSCYFYFFAEKYLKSGVAHPIAQSDLEYWTIFLCPFLRNFRVVFTQLEKTAEQWPSRNFWQSLDLRRVCLVDVLVYYIKNGEDRNANNRRRHIEFDEGRQLRLSSAADSYI